MSNINSPEESNDVQKRIAALAEYVGCESSEVKALRDDDNRFFQAGDGCEYLVLTDDQANEAVKTNISETLWGFRSEFLAKHIGNLNDRATQSLEKLQEKCCEDSNDLIRAMIKDYDAFVSEAVAVDGRGHFLSPYDGDEGEFDGYFIYRQ